MDLLVLAGGLGSRFGGLKQAEAIDDNGNFIIDYSIFDALSCGFNKVVVIVKPGTEKIFENTILSRAKGKNIVIVPQTFDDSILKKFGIDRQKPLGTAHAVLCAKNYICDNFCIINADDFYGKNSFDCRTWKFKHIYLPHWLWFATCRAITCCKKVWLRPAFCCGHRGKKTYWQNKSGNYSNFSNRAWGGC